MWLQSISRTRPDPQVRAASSVLQGRVVDYSGNHPAAERMNRATALEAEVNGRKYGVDPAINAGYRAQADRMRQRSAEQYLTDLEATLCIGPSRR